MMAAKVAVAEQPFANPCLAGSLSMKVMTALCLSLSYHKMNVMRTASNSMATIGCDVSLSKLLVVMSLR